MNMKTLSAAALAMGMVSPAFAQSAPAPVQAQTAPVGTTVYGSDGAEIGTIVDAGNNAVLLEVGDRSIPIPSDAITNGDNGATINVTRETLVAQFDQQVAAYEAQMNAAVTEGATLQTVDGQQLGTIQAVSDEMVVIDSAQGPLTLPKQLLTVDRQGTLIVRATMDQIQQAMAATPDQG